MKYSYKKKYDFNDPEQWKQLERRACNNNINVDGFPPAAYRYFESLRKLYEDYRYGNITKELAVKKKAKLLSDYKKTIADYDNWRSVYNEHQKNIRLAGTLQAELDKSQSLEEFAVKACEIIRCMTGDETSFKIRKNKVKELIKCTPKTTAATT